MKQIVPYYRVSTKGQGESGLGLEAQKDYVNHYFRNDEHEIIKDFTEVASAKSIHPKKRPVLNEAIAFCKQHGYYLAVAKLDRLSRKTEDALHLFSELNERLLSCDVPNMDKFTLTIFIAIADRERELISLRTKGALQSKVKRLKAQDLPTNWRTNPKQTYSQAARDKSVMVIKENAASNENTNRARDYAKMLRTEKKMTLLKIAHYLNERKFVTARGKAFQKTSVLRLLE